MDAREIGLIDKKTMREFDASCLTGVETPSRDRVFRSARRRFAFCGPNDIHPPSISMEMPMRVAKWGNSLAVRLPASVVEMLGLREGDDVEIVIAGTHRFEVTRDDTRAQALARLKALRRRLPKGFRFGRNEAHER